MEKKMCTNCETVKREPPETVDFFVYDDTVSRYERTVKKLWIALIVVVSLFFATNIGWLIYESQFETISYDYDQGGEGVNIIGDENEVRPYESTSSSEG